MSLDKMITDTRKMAEGLEGEEKVKAEGAVAALESAKEAGYTFTQDDLNRVDRQNKEALNALRQDMQQTLGAGWDDVKKTLEETLTGDEPDEGEGDTPPLQRLFAEIEKRDEAIAAERKERLSFQRELKQERLMGELNQHFEALDLQKPYHKAAQRFVSPSLSQLVDKAMAGEDVSEDLQAQANEVKELSPVWFEKPSDPNELPAYPNTRSQDGSGPRQLTDEERLARAESVI